MWQYTGRWRPSFALEPGPGQESVWDYPRPPRLAPDPRRVRVQDANRILADSRSAIRVLETASPPTFYILQSDIDFDALCIVPGPSVCEQIDSVISNRPGSRDSRSSVIISNPGSPTR